MDSSKFVEVYHLFDRNLRLESKGLISYLQTKESHTFQEICERFPDRKEEIVKALEQCESEGYLARSKDRSDVFLFQMTRGSLGKLRME